MLHLPEESDADPQTPGVMDVTALHRGGARLVKEERADHDGLRSLAFIGSFVVAAAAI